jgi:hypothetical protein
MCALFPSEIYAIALAGVLNKLDEDLLGHNLAEQERRAILQMVLKAIECHTRALPPSSAEVGFWMKVLDQIVMLPEEPGNPVGTPHHLKTRRRSPF